MFLAGGDGAALVVPRVDCELGDDQGDDMQYSEIKNRSDFSAALDRTEDTSNVIVVQCETSWCPNCKAVQPKIDELAKDFGDEKNVFWYKMNIEVAEGVAQEYNISAVPTYMLFKDGDMLPEQSITGPHHLRVRAMVEKNLKS